MRVFETYTAYELIHGLVGIVAAATFLTICRPTTLNNHGTLHSIVSNSRPTDKR